MYNESNLWRHLHSFGWNVTNHPSVIICLNCSVWLLKIVKIKELSEEIGAQQNIKVIECDELCPTDVTSHEYSALLKSEVCRILFPTFSIFSCVQIVWSLGIRMGGCGMLYSHLCQSTFILQTCKLFQSCISQTSLQLGSYPGSGLTHHVHFPELREPKRQDAGFPYFNRCFPCPLVSATAVGHS